jgi:hypothetical protein
MARRIDYRLAKKQLNKYHKFSFKMPPKGKDFTPQQKAAITRKAMQLAEYIERERSQKNTFIPYPKKDKMRDVSGVRTNKGIFFPSAGAKVSYKKVKGKKKKERVINIAFGMERETFYPIPKKIRGDSQKILAFAKSLAAKKGVNSVAFSIDNGRRTFRTNFDYGVDNLELYGFFNLDDEEYDEFRQADEENEMFEGVYLVYD